MSTAPNSTANDVAAGGRPRDAATRAFEAHGGAVFNLAFHLLGDAAAAEDVLQEVFVALVRSGVEPRDPRAWLLTAALNRVRDHVRRRDRGRVDAAARCDDLPSTAVGPEHVLLLGEQAREVAQALAALPVEQRTVVVLHACEDLGFAAVAAICGIPTDTAASRWRYACQKLRERLRRDGVRP